MVGIDLDTGMGRDTNNEDSMRRSLCGGGGGKGRLWRGDDGDGSGPQGERRRFVCGGDGDDDDGGDKGAVIGRGSIWSPPTTVLIPSGCTQKF